MKTSATSGEAQYGWPTEGWRLRLYIIIFEADTRLGRLFDLSLIWIILASVAVVLIDGVGEDARDLSAHLVEYLCARKYAVQSETPVLAS